jgi:hypothetical protein
MRKSICDTCGNQHTFNYQEYPGAGFQKEETCEVDGDGGEKCPQYKDITALIEKEKAEERAMQIKADRRDREFYFDGTGQDEEAFYGE